jgi:2-methylcitrate dehydratase PrpD
MDGAWTKRLHPALAVRAGIDAALLASEGYYGGEDGIAGPRGFLAAHSAGARPELLLDGFGDRPLEVRATSIKAHSCCRYKQGPIDALLEIRERVQPRIEDVSDVTIGLPTVAIDLIAEPKDAKRRPRSVVDAQFSMPFGAAVALLRGRAGLAEYVDAMLSDPDVIKLMDAVHCESDVKIDATFPEQWRAWVRLTTTDGSAVQVHVDDPKGDPSNPFTPEELRQKFDELTTYCWTDAEREHIVDTVTALAKSSTYGDLVKAVSFG